MTSPIKLPYFDFAQKLSPLGLDFPTRMTVLPFGGNALALVSPVPIDDALASAIAELGEVRYLIAPNLLHHLYLADASKRYPQARVLAPAALGAKRSHLTIHAPLEQGLPAELATAVDALRIEGAPAIDEFVFFHRPTRTLVVTDLVFNFVHTQGLLTTSVLYLGGCHGRVAQSMAWRFMTKDRPRAAASAERLLALPFETLVVAHGDVLYQDAHAQLTRALSWQTHGADRRAALP